MEGLISGILEEAQIVHHQEVQIVMIQEEVTLDLEEIMASSLLAHQDLDLLKNIEVHLQEVLMKV